MKIVFFIVGISLFASLAYANPIKATHDGKGEITITSLENDLVIHNIVANKGNCSTLLYMKRDTKLNYGEELKALSFAVKNEGKPLYIPEIKQEKLAQIQMFLDLGQLKMCNILELIIETNSGTWTATFK